jgi:hypothetical protein
MITRLSNYLIEGEGEGIASIPRKKLHIKWAKPDLGKEILHYDESSELEFYQHNIDISRKDIGKVAAKATKFYKYLIKPFNKGRLMELPLTAEDEFQVTRIQNLDAYEYENIVAGAYGRGYGDILIEVTKDIKKFGNLTLPAPIIIRFINFGETRRSEESSYFLFSGNRRINLALHYGIPIKAWVVDLIPSRRDVRDFAEKSGILRKGEAFFKEYMQKTVGKDSIDDLSARERFKIIQSLKSF